MIHPSSQRLLLLVQHAVRTRDVVLPAMDWERDLENARAHHVHFFAYLHINTCLGVPDHLLSNLRKEFLAAVRMAELRREQAAELLGTLAGKSISVMPLKGLWLAEHVYEEPAVRPMHDLDILVKKQEQGTAVDVLQQLGYQEVGRGDAKHRFFQHPSWPLPVELHVRVDNEVQGGLDPDSIWENATPSTTAGQPCLAPSLDDLILILTSHILIHRFGYFPLRCLLDLALVLRQAGPALDLYRILSRARSLNMVKGTGLLLDMAGTLAGLEKEVDFPPDFRPPPALLNEAWRLVLEHGAFRAQPPDTLGQVAKARNWLERISLLKNRLFLPPNELASYFPWANNPGMRPLALLARAHYLLRLYAGMVWRLARRDSRMVNALDIADQRQRLIAQLYPD
jgi:hypothetical protein